VEAQHAILGDVELVLDLLRRDDFVAGVTRLTVSPPSPTQLRANIRKRPPNTVENTDKRTEPRALNFVAAPRNYVPRPKFRGERATKFGARRRFSRPYCLRIHRSLH
jgi:hypothetical protein